MGGGELEPCTHPHPVGPLISGLCDFVAAAISLRKEDTEEQLPDCNQSLYSFQIVDIYDDVW